MIHTRTVAEEIGQRKPFTGPGQELVVTLLRTADEARRYMASVLSPEDVTLQQFNVLRILRGAGPEGLPTLEIGRRMIENQPGVTRLVDRLIAKGFVARERGVADRRRVVCTILPPALELLERVDGRIPRMDRDLAWDGDGGALVSLIADLNRLRARFRETQDGRAGG